MTNSINPLTVALVGILGVFLGHVMTVYGKKSDGWWHNQTRVFWIVWGIGRVAHICSRQLLGAPRSHQHTWEDSDSSKSTDGLRFYSSRSHSIKEWLHITQSHHITISVLLLSSKCIVQSDSICTFPFSPNR